MLSPLALGSENVGMPTPKTTSSSKKDCFQRQVNGLVKGIVKRNGKRLRYAKKELILLPDNLEQVFLN